MTTVGVASIPIKLDFSGVSKQVSQGGKEAAEGLTRDINGRLRDSKGRFVKTGEDLGDAVGKGVSKKGKDAADGLTSHFKGAFTKIAALAGGVAIGSQLVDLVGMGSSLDSMRKKVTTVFEGSAADIRKWADKSNEALGLTDEQVSTLAANFGDLMKPMGFTSTEAANMSKKVIDLSGALSAWSGGTKTAADVSGILTKAMLGERDELKSLGISISEADVDARLAAKGQQELTGAALDQAEAVATQELIFEKSTDAQKAWADGSMDAIKNQNNLKATVADLRESLANRLAPVVETVTAWLGDKLPGALDTASRWFNNVREAVTPFFRFIVDEAIPGIKTAVAEVSKVVGSFLDGLQGKGGEGSFLTDLGEAARGAVRVFSEDVLPVLKTVWAFIQDNLKPILIGLGVAFALVAGPVLLLVGAFIFAYQKFQWFRDGVALFMGLVKLAITTMVDIGVAAFKVISWVVQNIILPIFNRFKDFIVNFVGPLVSAVFQDIIVPAIKLVVSTTQKMWDTIKPILQTVISFVRDKLGPVWEGMRKVAEVAFKALPGLIGAALRLVGGIVAGFLDGVGSIADAIGLDDIAKVLKNGAGSARRWGQEGVPTNSVRTGGQGRGLALGGPIPGSHNRDDVPIRATPGEWVIKKPSVQMYERKYGPGFMKEFNAGHFGLGGLIPDIDLQGLADGVVDKARSIGTAGLERVWPKLGTGSRLFSASNPSGFPAAGANYLRDAIIQLIRGKEQAMGSQSGGGFSRAGGGGPAGQYTAGMQRARADILNLFGPMSVGGYSNRNIAGTSTRSQHALHRAWDFMTGQNVPRGNAVSRHLIANASSYGLKGLIWNAQKNFGSGWAPYGHPGGGRSATLQHLDHVHAEFFSKGGKVPYGLYDQGGFLPPGLSIAENRTGSPERVGGAGIAIGEVHNHGLEDVDAFWRLAEFHAMKGSFG